MFFSCKCSFQCLLCLYVYLWSVFISSWSATFHLVPKCFSIKLQSSLFRMTFLSATFGQAGVFLLCSLKGRKLPRRAFWQGLEGFKWSVLLGCDWLPLIPDWHSTAFAQNDLFSPRHLPEFPVERPSFLTLLHADNVWCLKWDTHSGFVYCAQAQSCDCPVGCVLFVIKSVCTFSKNLGKVWERL